MLNTIHLIVSLLLLLPSVYPLYDQHPAFTFMGLNLTQNHQPYTMILSNDEQKIAIYFMNATTEKPQYKILRFDGTQRCRKRVSSERQELVGWPQGQNLMFLNKSHTQVTMLATDCDSPYELATFPSPLRGAKFSTTSQQQTFAAFLTSQNQLHEYNLATKTLQAIYSPQLPNQTILSFEYSQNHRFLFMQVSDQAAYTDSRVRVYETDTLKKVRDIGSNLMMVKVIERGDYYLAVDESALYKVDMNGEQEKIVQFTENDLPLGFCTTDDVLVSLQIIQEEGLKRNDQTSLQQGSKNQQKKANNESIKVTLLIYSSDNGRLKQSIPLNYHPTQMKNTIMACNDQHLAFMDRSGNIIVYKYHYDFPVLIVVASVILAIMLFAVVMAVLFMRRINRRRKEQYRKMEENLQSLVTVTVQPVQQ